MIRRIILENYMAHERTVIEPAAGLTVLVGPNNCGKSAIVHALQTLCYNKPADFAVRHGAKEASVTVETDDGHVVTWRRKKGIVSYVIDGREIGRLGQAGVPDDLHKILRMPRIEPSNDNGAPFYVHFGLQKSPIFLLDDPPARAATFFASSSDAEKLLAMQRLHRERVRDNRRDLERLAAEAALVEQRIAATAPVTVVAEKVAEIEETYHRLIASQQTASVRADFLARLELAQRRRAVQAARVHAAAPLAEPPPFADTTALVKTLGGLKRLAVDVRRTALRKTATQPLRPPPAWRDAGPLQVTISRLHGASEQVRKARRVQHGVAELKEPPAIDQQRRTSLEDLVTRGRECSRRRKDLEGALRTADQAMAAVREQVRAWVEMNPNCPLCGSATAADAILAGEHAHV